MGTGKNSEKIKDYQRQIAQGFFYIGVTIIVFTAVCIAWFVSNTKVTATGASISAANNVPLLLASTGERQIEEIGNDKTDKNKIPGYKSKVNDRWQNILSPGTKSTYSSYVDCDSKKTVTLEGNQSLTLYTGSSGLAWYLNGQQELSPGAGGELELYFIPKQKGLAEVTFTLTAEGYIDDTSDGATQTVKAVTDGTATNFLNSHILFFTQYDESHGYRGLLGKTKISSTSGGETEENGKYIFDPSAAKTITVKAEEFVDGNNNKQNAFTVGTPYKVTIYWKWPRVLHNYLYNDKFSEDLFLTASSSDQKALCDYIVKSQNEIFDFTKKSTDDQGNTSESDTAKSTENISLDDIKNNIATYTEAYDQADEYIANQVKYVFVKVDAEVK